MEQLTIDDIIEYVEKNCIKRVNTSGISDHSLEDEKILMSPFKKLISKLFGNAFNDITVCDTIEILPENRENISLCSSLMYCIIDKFNTLEKNDQIICINKFFSKFLSEIRRREGLNRYITPTFIWDKKELTKAFSECQMTNNAFAYIVTYININVFIISKEKIHLFCMGKTFNIYKSNVMIYYDGNNYKPLTYKNLKLWTYDETPLKFMINNATSYITLYQQNKNELQNEFKIGYDGDIEFLWIENNINKKIEKQNKSDKQEIEELSDKQEIEELSNKQEIKINSDKKTSDKKTSNKKTSNKKISDKKTSDKKILDKKISDKKTLDKKISDKKISIKKQTIPETTEQVLDAVFIKPDCTKIIKNESHKYNENDLNKMKCVELHKIATDNNIKLTTKNNGKTKNRTKKELITEILKV